MGCRVIVGKEESGNGPGCAVLYCSVSGTAFGPLLDNEFEAAGFIGWLKEDPRWYTDGDLVDKLAEFRKREAVQ